MEEAGGGATSTSSSSSSSRRLLLRPNPPPSPGLSESREVMDLVAEMSDLLRTGLDRDGLRALVDLLEGDAGGGGGGGSGSASGSGGGGGAGPAAAAAAIEEVRGRMREEAEGRRDVA